MKDSKCGNFACKLHSLLKNPFYSEIICWSNNNTVIEIIDELRMEKEVLPHYFRQSKYQSFIRQLNLYGFKKMKSQQNSRFTHPQLLEGNSLSSILAVKSKKVKTIQNEEKLRDSNKVEEIQSDKGQEKKENINLDAPSTSLAHNRNSQQQTQNRQKINQINSAYFPRFVYFAFNPYFTWNLPQTLNNTSFNNQVPQITGEAEILHQS